MPIKDISINRTIGEILDEYCESITCIPTEEGKAYFKQWDGKIPPKLVRQLIYAGAWFALQYPDELICEWEGLGGG